MAQEVAAPARRKRKKPRMSLRSQLVPLAIGVYPLLLLWMFWSRSGVGLNPMLVAEAAALVLGFVVSLNYHFFYRHRPPMSVIKPLPTGWTWAIAALVLGVALIALYATLSGHPFGPVPGLSPLDSPLGWLRLGAASLLAFAHQHVPAAAQATDLPQVAPWVTRTWPLGAGTWGAMGWATIFGLGAMIAAAVRKEVFDPRQEPFGGTGWPFLRAFVGLYFGHSLGFALGIVVVGVAGLFGSLGSAEGVAPGAVRALAAALGAGSDPTVSFAMAFCTGGLVLAASNLFMGKADFTASFTDPKSEKSDPPMKVNIPPLPKTEPPVFDFSALGTETDALVQKFGREVMGLIGTLGLDQFDPAVVPAGQEAPKPADGATAEVPTTNLISARQPDFDTSFDSAMGQLSNIYVQVSAELGSMDCSLAEWLSLEEGSILEIPRQPENQVSVCINARPVGSAKPVVVGNHVAMKVLTLRPDALKQLQERR